MKDLFYRAGIVVLLFLALVVQHQSRKIFYLEADNRRISGLFNSWTDKIEKNVRAQLSASESAIYPRLRRSISESIDSHEVLQKRQLKKYFGELSRQNFAGRQTSSMGLEIEAPFLHFKCDETKGAILGDSSNNHDGVSTEDFSTMTAIGKMGGGLKFDGIGDYAKIDNIAGELVFDGRGTLCLWFRRLDRNGVGTLVSFGDSKEDSSFSMYVSPIGSTNSLFLGFSSTNVESRRRCWYGSISLNMVDDWIHIALVQDGQELKLYRNGKLEPISFEQGMENKEAWFSSFPNFNRGRIGCSTSMDKDNVTPLSNVVLDDIRFYRRDLSDNEIKSIYNEGMGQEDSAIKEEVSFSPPLKEK